MKARIISVVVVVLLATTMSGLSTPAQAAAYGSPFVTSITYQNVGDAPATVSLNFYAEASGTPIPINRPDLPAGAGTSLYVGGLSQITSGFLGSAVMSSSQPVVATLVQIGSGTIKNRPLTSGFSGGASEVLIPTVLKDTFGYHSMFSIQNVDSVGADITLTFVPTSGTPIISTISNLPAGAAKFIDMATLADITSSTFNGSVKIQAVKVGTSTPGTVVASSMELQIAGDLAYAFEGAAQTASTIYMPSALCKFGPNANTNSAYAVQNTSSAPVDVSVTYSNGRVDGPYSLAAGAKRSFDGCGASNPTGFIGSAVINATGGEIVAVGKIYGGGLSTAFLGFPSGGAKVSLPYVRWTEAHWTDGTRQRAYIAIQNVGAGDLAAGAVTVKYYDKNGVLVGTHTLGAIPVGGKVNSNPMNIGAAGSEFGAYTDGSFGGAAIVEGPAGSQLAVVVRIQTYIGGGNSVGEDYQGVTID
ncbi:MAG: hypothetical protein AB2L21_04580 [Anaerolineaceae bacterium]